MYICYFPISNWIFDKLMIYIISIPSCINAPLLVTEIIGVGFFIPPPALKRYKISRIG